MDMVFAWLFAFIAMKSILIGSDFSIVDYVRHGKEYSDWYFNRESYKEFCDKQKEEE